MFLFDEVDTTTEEIQYIKNAVYDTMEILSQILRVKTSSQNSFESFCNEDLLDMFWNNANPKIGILDPKYVEYIQHACQV